MVDILAKLWIAVIVNLIASIILGTGIILWKWLRKLGQPSLGTLKPGEWYSYYYKLERGEPILKTDMWKIKKSVLNKSRYNIRIIDSTKRPKMGWRKRFKKALNDICCKIKAFFKLDYTCIGKMVLAEDACYTAKLNVGCSPVYIRFLKPTEIRSGNNILRGVAITIDENNCIRSGVNILTSKKLTKDKLMEILNKTSNVDEQNRFLRLESVALDGS